jgi:hypothetical protein
MPPVLPPVVGSVDAVSVRMYVVSHFPLHNFMLSLRKEGRNNACLRLEPLRKPVDTHSIQL